MALIDFILLYVRGTNRTLMTAVSILPGEIFPLVRGTGRGDRMRRRFRPGVLPGDVRGPAAHREVREIYPHVPARPGHGGPLVRAARRGDRLLRAPPAGHPHLPRFPRRGRSAGGGTRSGRRTPPGSERPRVTLRRQPGPRTGTFLL